MKDLTMEKKKIYETPSLEAVNLAYCDILTTSLGENGFDGETDTDW